MNAKNTWLLLAMAALLAGFIFAWEKYVAVPARQPVFVLPGFNPQAITSIQVRLSGQPELLAQRTNDSWQLIKPLLYPARPENVEALLAALGSIRPDRFISARELIGRPDAEADFGFDKPFATVTLFSGPDRKQVILGARTAPGDQVFVEVAGIPGVHLVSTNLLGVFPQSAGDWRDPALLDWKALTYDRVLVNNGARVTELQRSPTNGQWRLVRQKARADSLLVNELLKRLQALRVAQFITDNPQADLDAYGLQTPDLDIAFASGTNTTAALHFGKSPTNNANLVYARRSGMDSVVTVPRELLAPWRVTATDFYDRHLLTIRAVPESIEVNGADRFTLARQTNNTWRVLPQDFVADTNYLNQFILALVQLQVEQFVKDVVIESALTNYGLATPLRQYVLNPGRNDTNAAVVQLLFGASKDGLVFARRADEDSVYAVKQADFDILPAASWELRDRRIWNFSETDVARVIIEQGGRKRELLRLGTNDWSVAGLSGSNNLFAVEETVHRAGDLSAAFWTARGQIDRAAYGFTNPVHRLTFELKDGAKHEVEFGGDAPSQFPYAIVTLGGETWLCEFPWATYQFILTYLSIPVRDDL